jgi:hypothetical protein
MLVVIVNIYFTVYFSSPLVSDWMENEMTLILFFFLFLFIYFFFFFQRQIYILNCVGEDSINDLVLRLYSPYISAYITEDSPAGESGALGQRVLLLPRHITRREI